MKAVYDPKQDILQISLQPSSLVQETTQISPGLVLDYDEDGHLIGIEIRRASEKVDDPQVFEHQIGQADTNKPVAMGT